MKSLVRGALLTLKSMGFKALLREAVRRTLGREYCYRGISVNSDAIFRFIRYILLRGYDVYRLGNDVCVHTYFGELCVDATDTDLLCVLAEPLEDMYGFVNVKDAVVVDIGAFIGETALLFLSKGASRVYALEPVQKHYQYLLKNINRNNASDRVVALNYGAWFREALLTVNYEGTGTGLQAPAETPTVIKARDLGDILREVFRNEGRIDLVKMDCEGCEYSLLSLYADDLRLANQYVVEIHGSETPIIDKMSESGFKHTFVRRVADMVSVHYFTQ
ncbi:MAG: FkbM family methyltransferase [Desulfurococcaceae archaeon]